MPDTGEQCAVEMPKRFITGSVTGQFIGSMKKLVQEIIPHAFNNQFQEPQITNTIPLEHYADTANQNIECPADSTHTSRPSDFRIKPICELDQPHNIPTTTKSFRKLFNEFIVDLDVSIERYERSWNCGASSR